VKAVAKRALGGQGDVFQCAVVAEQSLIVVMKKSENR
jgi:hypothetical protein